MIEKTKIDELAKAIERTGMLDSFSKCEIVAEELYRDGYGKEDDWISVEERLPSESGVYLVYTFTGNRLVLDYSALYKVFNAFDDLSDKIANSLSIKVTHWMPLPEPPKGEE